MSRNWKTTSKPSMNFNKKVTSICVINNMLGTLNPKVTLTIQSTFVYKMPYEDNEFLLKKEKSHYHKHPSVPNRAIKSIIVSILLVLLGLICSICLIAVFLNGNLEFSTKCFALFIIMVLSLPCGIYTLVLAYKIYNRTPGYTWPMIFF